MGPHNYAAGVFHGCRDHPLHSVAFRFFRQAGAVPYRENPDNPAFGLVEEPVWADNYLAEGQVGELGDGSA